MSNNPDAPGFKPLYQQVKQLLTDRIMQRNWKPGAVLPSEQKLADELGVSQGTVRKALDAMTDEKLLVRRQGKGTFVAEHDQERILFQFFKVTPDEGERRLPDSLDVSIEEQASDSAIGRALDIASDQTVWTIKRCRTLDSRAVIYEVINIPASLMPKLDQMAEIPNNLYEAYAHVSGGAIARAQEKIKAINCDRFLASKLNCKEGQALLLIHRKAFGLDGTLLEVRESYCLTDAYHYLADLS